MGMLSFYKVIHLEMLRASKAAGAAFTQQLKLYKVLVR
jgi:hypothetical protein